MCEGCWNKMDPERRAVRMEIGPEAEVCCFCGERHSSGIYIRRDGLELRCKGECPHGKG